MKKLKSVVLLVTIIMIANLLIPTMTSLAALSGNYTISFSENYEVNNVTVTTNIPSGNQTVNENTNIHLNNFDSATMRAFILADDGFETDLVVDERGDTNIGTADANSAPTNSTLMFKVATKPGAVTNSGLNITFLSQSGKVWYKFNEEQEREVSSNLTDALIAGEKLTIKGENRTIGRLAIKFDNGEWQNLDKDAFKSDRGITLDNITARIIMLEVEYVNDNQEQNNFEDINVKATFKDTEGEVAINNEHTPEGPSYDGKLEKAGYTDSNKKNKIVISTSADFPVASKVKINGVTYDFKEEGYEVPGASDYIIEVEGDPSIITPKTIIWTNPDYVPKDEEDAAWTADFSIGHGYARAIEVYDKDNNLVKPDEYINTTPQPDGSKSDEYGLNNGFGWVKIMPGYKVVFEFVPEYGYQLTGIKINDEVLEPQDTINRFEFTMLNGGNIHFSAEFTKTEDIVKADSKKVSSGKVSLGENELSGGSAQLTVNDVTLSSDKITGFQNAANGLFRQ